VGRGLWRGLRPTGSSRILRARVGYVVPMPASVRHHLQKLEDYFSAERVSPHRHEFADGQIFLMAGGSPRHNYLETRFLEAVGQRLVGGRCFTITSNQRIATADGLYTYADGSVFCGAMEVGAEQTATNPVLVVEILSDGTRAYDRGEKLDRYRSIPGLRHVVLIEPDAVDVEVWTRGLEGWTRTVSVDRADQVVLDAIGVLLPVAEIYAGVERVPV
jgi:Uma2 family endonuclease